MRYGERRRRIADRTMRRTGLSGDEVRVGALDEHCAYCGVPFLEGTARRKTMDHVVPLSRGGSQGKRNQVACCYACNKAKGPRTLEEWRRLFGNRGFFAEEHGVEIEGAENPNDAPWVTCEICLEEVRGQRGYRQHLVDKHNGV